MNTDDIADQAVDEAIADCLVSSPRNSFFLYAGAGSGKTRSLVLAIRRLIESDGGQLSVGRRKIAVITYTRAASEEIAQRLEFDPRVDVRTIHSYAWSLVQGFDADIRSWLAVRLTNEVRELGEMQAKGRAGKASEQRAMQIDAKVKRLESLPGIKRFIYSPTGDNRGREALNHSEVIALAADLLIEKEGLRNLMIAKNPVVLIDESQDTNKVLMDALLKVHQLSAGAMCLGLFGDAMQRIYLDGKEDLEGSVPEGWARPVKRMNHRSRSRIVDLINSIRAGADGQQQLARTDRQGGVVRLFVLPLDVPDNLSVEQRVSELMSEASQDREWLSSDGVMTLILEHHMAARRFGFEGFFEPLYRVDAYRTSLLDGSLPGLAFFSHDILPLVDAIRADDAFAIASHVRKRSPLLAKEELKRAGARELDSLQEARNAVGAFRVLLQEDRVTLRDALRNVAKSRLFEIPESLNPFLIDEVDGESNEGGSDDELLAWRDALSCELEEVARYDLYIRGAAGFGTHQGVKGLEFPRVMVILSDTEARGFLFSYEKLFGAKEPSRTDLSNLAEGKETSLDRTRRLFYVTCSRAEDSLAVVCYSADPSAVRKGVLGLGWFSEDEIVTFDLDQPIAS